jgi:hypothetical protein
MGGFEAGLVLSGCLPERNFCSRLSGHDNVVDVGHSLYDHYDFRNRSVMRGFGLMIYRPLNVSEANYVANAMAEAEEFFAGRSIQQAYDHFLSTTKDGSDHAIKFLGFLFGSSFLPEDWLEWGMALDAEYGDEICLRVSGRDLGCHPLSMIRNRLEDGEQWDLAELRDSTIARLRQLGQHAA